MIIVCCQRKVYWHQLYHCLQLFPQLNFNLTLYHPKKKETMAKYFEVYLTLLHGTEGFCYLLPVYIFYYQTIHLLFSLRDGRLEMDVHMYFKSYTRSENNSGKFIHHSLFNRTENNITWYQKVNVINFLRDTGRYIRIGDMLSRTSVVSRMDSAEGISFTEFSYQVLCLL